jgi:hypothetical protein
MGGFGVHGYQLQQFQQQMFIQWEEIGRSQQSSKHSRRQGDLYHDFVFTLCSFLVLSGSAIAVHLWETSDLTHPEHYSFLLVFFGTPYEDVTQEE